MVMRWWQHIKMLKRAGRGHNPDGVAATQPGSLAVECPACPHDGRNLPDNWRTAPAAIMYVFSCRLQTRVDSTISQLVVHALRCHGRQFQIKVEGPSNQERSRARAWLGLLRQREVISRGDGTVR
jgi:hypothetical protein